MQRYLLDLNVDHRAEQSLGPSLSLSLSQSRPLTYLINQYFQFLVCSL
jgi:hypothetical protein